MARKSRKNVVTTEAPKVSTEKIWRAALYIRLSVEFNGKRGDSLETQQQIMEAYLALCPDIEIEGIYTDNGITGRTFEREAFQRILDDVEAGKINCIVVKDLSRLGRNTIDTGYYIEKYFPLHGVRFISVNDQFDSEDSENSGSHLIVPLKNMINEAYAADISRKVKAQQRQAMRDGEFVGSRPPYGYRKDPDNCHRLLVNEDTAPVVRQIFQWTADGVPLNVVVKRLNEANILTPGFYAASIGIISSQHLIGGGNWQTWTVSRILADEVYLGHMVQGKHVSVRHKQVPTKPDEWVIVQNTHEPLVDCELFAKANVVRAQAKKRDQEKAAKIPYSKNILQGRIFCGYCGKNLHRERLKRTKHGDRYYYHCISNQRIKENTCGGTFGYLREEDLFNTILTIIRQQAKNVIGKSLRLQQYSGRIVEQKVATDQEISQLQRKTEKNRKFLAGLLESVNSGILTRVEYLEMKEDYTREIHAAVERVQQLQRQQRTLQEQMDQCVSLADRLAVIGEDTELTALLVDQLIERITVNSSNDVSIQFQFESDFEQLMGVLKSE